MATINGSAVRVTFRVHEGAGRLFVTADGKIWYTTHPAGDGPGYSHVANVGDRQTTNRLTKHNICRAANCY